MKFRIIGFCALVCGLFSMLSCSQDNVYHNSSNNLYEGAEYVMFADSIQQIAIQDDTTYHDIIISATTACDYDRTFGVEVVDKGSNAIEGLHYDLQSNTVVIKAGELTSSVKIRGHFDEYDDTDSIGVMLRLFADKNKIWDIHGTDTKVILVKVCPFDINNFVGPAKLTSTFFNDYMQDTEIRLLRTELSEDVKNGIVLKDFMYDGYDITVSFDSSNPLAPILNMEPQVISSTHEAFEGAVWGNDKLMVMQPSSATSYYNVCQNFAFQYMTFYVDGVGSVGTYVNVIEWITEEEYNYLKKQGY